MMRHLIRIWILVAVCVVLLAMPHAPAEEKAKESGTVKLPQPKFAGSMSVEESLHLRRSVREYDDRALTLDEVSQLLWAAQGITASWGGRTAPSAGALYPLEVYLAAGKVDGLSPGVYCYVPKTHALRAVRSGDVRDALARAALGQSCVRKGSAVIIIAAVYRRTERKYGSRSRRYVHIEVGSVCQNVYLQCESLTLGTVAVGAFEDKKIREIIGESPEPLLLMPVGARQKIDD